MVKAIMGLGFFSVVVIVLFIVMCFLMSDINPPPLKIDDTRDEHRPNELQVHATSSSLPSTLLISAREMMCKRFMYRTSSILLIGIVNFTFSSNT